jgi:hypothetical protein
VSEATQICELFPKWATPARRPVTPPQPKPLSDHTLLIRYFCEKWEEKYPPHKYPFQKCEVRAIKPILRYCGGLTGAKRAVDAYLAREERFLSEMRHPLRIMESRLPQLIVAAGRLSKTEAVIARTASELSEAQRYTEDAETEHEEAVRLLRALPLLIQQRLRERALGGLSSWVVERVKDRPWGVFLVSRMILLLRGDK